MDPWQLYSGIGLLVASLIMLVIRTGGVMFKRRRKQLVDLAQQQEEAARQKRIAEARLPAGEVTINTEGIPRSVGQGLVGSLLLVGGGSYGQNQLIRVLILLYLCGLERLVGLILLIQHNSGERDRFKDLVPICFHDRIIYGYSPAFSGGFANRPLAYTMERVDRWTPPIREATVEAAYWHEHWTGRPPGQIIAAWSLGGQAPVLLPVMETLHATFPEAQIVAMTSLPKVYRNRQKFIELTCQHIDTERHGLAGWVVTDELLDWKNADFNAAALIPALSNAQLYDDAATQLNNVYAQAFTEQPGSVLGLHYARVSLPGRVWRVEDELLGYAVSGQRLVDAAQQALFTIEQGKGTSSVFLPLGEPGTTIYDVLMANVGYDRRHDRDDMQWLSDHVEAGYTELLAHLNANGGRNSRPGLLYGLANYELKYGSLATVINPVQPLCDVHAVRLAAVKGGINSLAALAEVPPHLQLPYAQVALLPGSNNG